MTNYAHTFTLEPPEREDNIAWTHLLIEEGAGASGPWTLIDTQAIPPVNSIGITTTAATLEQGYYRFQFRDASLVLSPHVGPIYDPSAGGFAGMYCTPQDLRDEMCISADTDILPDSTALRVIETACDLIDEELGARPPNTTTGRKVTQIEVEAWQWTKLTRATVKFAAMIYTKPDVIAGQQWKKMSGPDFSLEGRVGSRFGPTIGVLLNQTGLRRLTTTMSRGRQRWRHGFPSNADPVYED